MSAIVQDAKTNIAAFEDVSKQWEKVIREVLTLILNSILRCKS